MSIDQVIKLRDVLRAPEEFSWADSLFVAKQAWELDSDCAVLNLDDIADDEDEPIFAMEHGLAYALSVADVQDVVRNATAQKPECSIEDRLAALIYYREHDAFIEF